MEIMTGNKAVAEAVKLAKPKVISVYPITPQTTIAEHIAEYVANGELDAEYVKVESEHSAISVCVGASSTGVRTFTATSSQGLALMHEILFIAAGLRTPIVLANANRSLSAPINIWNDHQDSIAERDSGWLQFYVENAQEALDFTLIAYKVSENKDVLLPSMVCLDGFILTHTMEPVAVPSQKDVDNFLPSYKPEVFLDPDNPVTIGAVADPNYYMEARYQIEVGMKKSLNVIHKANKEFKKIFGRKYGFVEEYRCDDAKIVLVAMGSVCGTIKEVVDKMREKGEKVGLLKVIVYRPFPVKEIEKVLNDVDKIGVIDKNVTFSMGGALYTDLKSKLSDKEIYGFIAGLGGRDITPNNIKEIIEKTKNPREDVTWIGLKR
ncbi:pyruvate ferredoxin oxidoreductase, alpha subunit [Methanothermus fervidus DSM 2088]|uniref:Pyruvate synthase subunit PorA n=1 Tax=Methanothermus fervidus (strain ATCC 43054 / DSM 2088 / JCM 10308 / V24 S) TaxID=523846 RepID=E3GXN3_METFV|nr:pyruvate synthase subunit PorA [Methanothermus fervidus]ADP77065.1 pyruvate ferredoxin oxidoreductase, alpha subunit [Methanothermus fervidus DSM 2088]